MPNNKGLFKIKLVTLASTVFSLIVALVAMAAPQQAKAATIYYARADSLCNLATSTGPNSATASSNSAACVPAPNNGPYTAFAKSDSGGLGVDVSGTQICCQSGGSPSATAWARADFSITGPAGFVSVSANLNITYGLGGGLPNDENVRYVEARVNLGAGPDYFSNVIQRAGPNGVTTTSNGFGFQLPANAICAIGACDIITPEVILATNTPYEIYLSLHGQVNSGVDFSVGTVSARDTFYFKTSGPVFNLPNGYTVNIPGLNVVNNRVVTPAQENVPEPRTTLLLACGLFGIAILRQKGLKH